MRAGEQTPGSIRKDGSRATGSSGAHVAVDLFAGCGGATLGFKWAGFEVAAAVEVDPTAASTYSINHPEVSMIREDIGAVDPETLVEASGLNRGECAAVIGCPPCQGFSTHRLRGAGVGDSRNYLILVFAEMIESLLPAFFVFENVPGLLRRMDSPWLVAKERLTARGYRIVEGIVDAADYGVPQRRKRLTSMGCRLPDVAVSLPPATHAKQRDLWYRVPWRSVRDAIGDLEPLANGERSASDPLHCASRHDEASLRRFAMIPQDGGSRGSLPADLQLACHRTHDGHRDVYGRLWWDRPAGTITGGCTQPSKGRFLHPEQDRGLTLREAARLQGFPDQYKFEGSKQQMALQIGNALPPRLGYALASVVKAALAHAASPHKEMVAEHI